MNAPDRSFEAADTLNAVVAREPRALETLRRLGLDTCCGGALTLAAAAAAHDLDLDALLDALRQTAEERP